MASRTVRAVTKNTDDLKPLFSVSFTNGLLDPSAYNTVSARVLKCKHSERLHKLVVKAGDMEYAGDYDQSTRDDGKYIGVEDIESGEMTLVPLKRVRLRPAVSLGQEPDEWIEPAKKSRQEQNDSLIEAFGGAKQKQRVMKRKRHGLDQDMINAALDSANVEDISVTDSSTVETPVKTAAEEDILPPHDTETTNPDKCYPLEGYFPEYIRKDLEEFVDDFACDASTLAAWKSSKRYPEFILTQLEKLPLEELHRRKTSVYIKYLLFLLRLHAFKSIDLKQKDPFSSQDNESLYQMPGSCFDYLLNTYTVKAGKSRVFPQRLKDKALITILLLALRLENNSFCCNKLMADLKVGGKKICDLAKAMGCKAKMNRKAQVPEIILELAAPLKFPAATPAPRRRR